MSGTSAFYWNWIVTRGGVRRLDAGSRDTPIEATLPAGYARYTDALVIPPETEVTVWTFQANQEETFEGLIVVVESGAVDLSWLGDKPTDPAADPPDLTALGTHETWNTKRACPLMPVGFPCQDVIVNPSPSDHAAGPTSPPLAPNAEEGLIYQIKAYNPSATVDAVIQRYWAQ